MTPAQWELVTAAVPMVRRQAKSLAAKLPAFIDSEDLLGPGMDGLLDAAIKFDPERGTSFRSYAAHRIRGAMLDALRGSHTELGMRYTSEINFGSHDELLGDMPDEEIDGAAGYVVPADQRPSPEMRAHHAKLRAILHRTLGCLEEREHHALLAHANGTTLREIGGKYGRSTSWASALLRKAKWKMRRELAMYRLDADAA